MYKKRKLGFTVIELLVVIGVISLLIAILMPAMSAGRHAAMDLKCKANLRAVTMKFINFADESGEGLRGQSRQLGPLHFRLEDFQESVYGIDEFWQGPEHHHQSMLASEQIMMCPAGPSRLERQARIPCSSGAIGPKQNVSIGFNKRLETRTRYINGRPYPARAYPTSKILQYPNVPLLFDVDGEIATRQDDLPYYSAPPLRDDNSEDIYESGQYWFPSFRHRGRMNVGFVGGHVVSTSHPLTEPWWKWDYQPDP